MYETILCLALVGQIEMNVELGEHALDRLPAVAKPAGEMTSERRQEIEANKAAAAARKAERLNRRREIQYARGRARAYARGYRMANRSNYPTGFAQQAAAMRSASYGLHLAATAQFYGRRVRADNCNVRRSYFYR